MAIIIIEGVEWGGQRRAVLACTVTDWAFGPLFRSRAEAEAFLAYLAEHDGRDARAIPDRELETIFVHFVTEVRVRKDGPVVYYHAPRRKKIQKYRMRRIKS